MTIKINYPIYFQNEKLEIGKLIKLATASKRSTYSLLEKDGDSTDLEKIIDKIIS